MVFRGGPSRGCKTCRTRRIKCDEGRPSCGQCIKSKRVCHGYRSEVDLLFRNKTCESVAQGCFATVITVANNPPRWTDEPPKSEPSHDDGVAPPFLPPLASLAPSIEDTAVNFFFSRYCLMPRHPEVCAGHLECLPALYATSKPDSALASATLAIAFAVYAIGPYSGHRLSRARVQYGEALSRVKKALLDPIEARQNHTLMTILLFGLIESITATADSLPRWGTHGQAAITLIKLRGKDMLQDEVSTKMLFIVRMQMIRNHINRSIRLTDFLGDDGACLLRWVDVPAIHRDKADQHLNNLFALIPDLRAQAFELLRSPREGGPVSDVRNLMTRAIALDQQLSDWLSGLDETWTATRIHPQDCSFTHIDFTSPTIYSGKIDIYYDVWVSNTLNFYRVARLFVSAITTRCVAWFLGCSVDEISSGSHTPNPDLIANFNQSRAVMQRSVDEICASVPFHIGTDQATSLSDIQAGAHFPPREFPHNQCPRAGGGFLLVWPLLVSRCVTTVPEAQRAWIRERMSHIGRHFGIQLLEVLGHRTSFWDGWPLFDVKPGETLDVAAPENLRNIWRSDILSSRFFLDSGDSQRAKE